MIQSEVYTFLWSILIGVILAFIFDLFRISRRKGTTNVFVVCMQDVLYFFILAFIIIMSTFFINDGELRGYMVLGYALGAIFYLLLFSKMIIKFFSTIFDFIELCNKKVLNGMKKMVSKMKFTTKRIKKEKV
ncbi:MAG: spore cortex biosynthesis protein YabQ [Clostridia bacterium]|nr:spore cortex biosynthesis protein YabQ [Clostridia bacterium]